MIADEAIQKLSAADITPRHMIITHAAGLAISMLMPLAVVFFRHIYDITLIFYVFVSWLMATPPPPFFLHCRWLNIFFIIAYAFFVTFEDARASALCQQLYFRLPPRCRDAAVRFFVAAVARHATGAVAFD
jgi:hypothetical protein